MPETVQRDVLVKELRKDDVFAQTHDVVLNLVRKNVWGHVTVALGDFEDRTEVRRIRLDTTVTVLRSELTAEEKAAQMREFMAHELRRNLRGWLETNPADVVQPLVNKFRDNQYNGELFSSYQLGDVLDAQAMYKQALVLRRWVHVAFDRRVKAMSGEGVELLTDERYLPSVDDPSDLNKVDDELILDAYAGWMYDLSRRDALRNPLSRSTSPLSNLLEDLDVYAAKMVMERIHWAGADDEIARRVAALRDEANAKRKHL